MAIVLKVPWNNVIDLVKICLGVDHLNSIKHLRKKLCIKHKKTLQEKVTSYGHRNHGV